MSFVYFLKCIAPADPHPKVYFGATNRPLEKRLGEHWRGTTETLQGILRAQFLNALVITNESPFRVERYLRQNPRAVLPLLDGIQCKTVQEFWKWARQEHISMHWFKRGK